MLEELKRTPVAVAQASPVEAPGALRNLPKPLTGKRGPLTGGAVFVHVLGQLAELLCGQAQCLGRMGTDRRHHFVVQVSDDFFFFPFQLLRRAAKFGVQLAPKIFEPRFCLGIVL